MTTYRDIILKQKNRLDDKQDRLLFKRAVLTTEGGLQTSSDPFNDVWASASERRAWYMTDGAVQPAQILCRKVSDPYVGLGVIIGYADGSNQLEVLSDDFFLTKTGDPTGWASTSPRDFEPGGRKQMWVYTKVITPLATYPGSGIKVNVISGDYPYLGTRKSYAGSVNYDLTASVPGGGLCRYAGLYLDASNTLQTVNGATIAAGSTPAEPSWPAGAFRLCVVLLTNGDTSIDFANILDRRMAWSDQQSGSARVWPFAHVLTVSTTDTDADYSTVAAAIAAAAAGDAILLEMETSSETITVNKAVTIIGWSRAGTIFTNPITISSAATLINVKVSIAAGTNSKGFIISANTTLYNCEAVTAGSTTSRAVEISAGTTYVVLGYYESTGAGTSNEVYVSGGGAILEDPILSGGNVSGSVQGTYRNSLGYVTIAALTQLRFVSTASMTSGVWQTDESALLRTKRADLAAAITAAASGDSIKLDTDTYSVAASQNIDTSITIEGDGSEATIYTTSVSNATAFDITTDSITVVFKDMTLRHTGGGVAATGIFSNNTGVTVILDNAVLEISSGAGTTSRGLWIESGTWILRNGAKIVVTSGTNQYGIYNDAGAATVKIGAGCEVGGGTNDIYSDQAGSTITLNSAALTNDLVSWAGVLNWEPENKIVKNLLYSSMTHSLWQEGTTLNDIADDTYGPDSVWVVLNKDNAPDVSGQAGGSTDPFTTSFRCTFDSNTAQAGIVQFIEATDTYPLRGQVVSLSADLWGTNVTTLRMAVIVWTSTADTVTSDVVGTWAAGNPTLATNWAYIGTPAAITITSTRTRFAVNNLAVPTNANNLGVLIWTDAAESSGDYWEVARVQLERGPVATEFVARKFADELALIQRYLESPIDLSVAIPTTTQAISMSVWSNTIGNGQQYGQQFFKTVKRVAPTVTVYPYTTVANTGRISLNNGTDQGANSGNAVSITAKQFGVQNNSGGNVVTNNNLILFSWKADARL